MRFRLEGVIKGQKWTKYIAGLYLFGFKNKNNKPIKSKFLTFISFIFIGLFILSMISSLLLFGYILYQKTTRTEIIPTTFSIVIPSISQNTLDDFTKDVNDVKSGKLDKNDMKKRYVVFIPFILLIPIIGSLSFFHELGHYFICRRYGIKVKEYGFGAFAILSIPIFPLAYVDPTEKSMKQSSNFAYFSMISAGVGMNIIICFISLIMFIFINTNFLYLFFLFNLSVGAFNALPLIFLDGGLFVERISGKLKVVTSVFVLLILVAILLL